MSKMDALRKMREERYAEQQARAAKGAKAAGTPARRPVAPAKPASAEAADDAPATTDEALCGHRNMSGRTCTREQGHSAKSHRYS